MKHLSARSCLIVFAIAGALAAQTVPTPRPIQQMPFSPVLDVGSLDRATDPCTDFYQFSCGGWKKNNPIPADQATWSVYGKLADENQQFLWGILEADAKATNRNPIQQKIGDAFGACMDTAAIDKRGLDPSGPNSPPSIKSTPAPASAQQPPASTTKPPGRFSSTPVPSRTPPTPTSSSPMSARAGSVFRPGLLSENRCQKR